MNDLSQWCIGWKIGQLTAVLKVRYHNCTYVIVVMTSDNGIRNKAVRCSYQPRPEIAYIDPGPGLQLEVFGNPSIKQ